MDVVYARKPVRTPINRLIVEAAALALHEYLGE